MRPAGAADREEQVDEVGLGGQQLAELVDDHEQVRQRRRAPRSAAVPAAVVSVMLGRLPASEQQLLAALDLARSAHRAVGRRVRRRRERLETIAAQCGRSPGRRRSRHPCSRPAPSTADRGAWVIASVSTSVRSTSDLPEPGGADAQSVRPHPASAGSFRSSGHVGRPGRREGDPEKIGRQRAAQVCSGVEVGRIVDAVRSRTPGSVPNGCSGRVSPTSRRAANPWRAW